MKYILLSLLLVSCGGSKMDNSANETSKLEQSIDSLINHSKKNMDSASAQITKTDSVVVQKVEHTVKKIQHLETENKQLKQENAELKVKLNEPDDAGKPYGGLPVSPN